MLMIHRWEGPPGFDLTKRAWLWYDGNATFKITIKNVRKGSTAIRKISCILKAPNIITCNQTLSNSRTEFFYLRCTVKKAVNILGVPVRNTSLMSKKYNSNVEILEILCIFSKCFSPLCYRMRTFDIRTV